MFIYSYSCRIPGILHHAAKSFSLQEHNVQQLSQVLFPVKAKLFLNTLHVNVPCGIIIYPHILITNI